MTLDPFQRFLGVNNPSDPMALLGLAPDHCEPVQIEAALRERLGVIFQHPDGRSDDAERVRQALRRAAEQLKRLAHRPHTAGASSAGSGLASARPQSLPHVPHTAHHHAHPQRVMTQRAQFNLTPFDRLVLAVLIGYGGWNAHSRARLVALAASYGVSVHGLIRVVQGLAEYARSRGPRLGVREITSGQPLAPYSAVVIPSPGTGPALLDRLTHRLATELHREDAWPTIKLALIFGLVTLLGGVVALRLMLSPDKPQPSTPNNVAAHPVPPASVGAAATNPQPTAAPPEKHRIAQFSRPPTFLGNGMPVEAVNAADQCPELAGQIDELARKLIVNDEPSEAVYRNWEALIQVMASGWVLAPASSHQQVDSAIAEALRAAADTPSVSDRLLRAFTPPASISQPLEIWRGAWSAGMLGKISRSEALPPVVAQRAQSQMEVALGTKAPQEPGFETAATAWLDQQVQHLVKALDVDDNTYDFWELWIAAQRALGRGPRHDQALMSALEAVLAAETDLARPGPSVNVLGRLLAIALENPTPLINKRVLEWFDDPDISSRDLWVVTSLISQSDAAAWFPDRLVLPEDADQNHRWRVRDDLAASWPQQSGDAEAQSPPEQPIQIDAEVGHRWTALVQTVLQQPLGQTPEALLHQLIAASRMVEAADALVVQNLPQAQKVLDEVEAVLKSGSITASGTSNPTRAGQSIGRDGEFAVAYEQLGKNIEKRVELLQSLRVTAGTDLGPLDAQLLVHEAYNGSPQDVRSASQAIVAQQFSAGPAIAMEMLDQFPDAPSSDAVSQTIEKLTGQVLPEPRSATWEAEARLALVGHALKLRSAENDRVDELAMMLKDSYLRRLALLREQPESILSVPTAQEAAALVAQALMDKAATSIADAPAPDDLVGLQRRHATRLRLAEGPIQNLVVHQLAILDLLTYLAVAQQPSLRAAALDVLRESSDRRSRMASVLELAVETERAIARLWKLRMELALQTPGPATRPGEGSSP